jgi:hypothetical protein
MPTAGSIVGCDFSGTMVTIGPKCSKSYKASDRIAGVTHGSNASDLGSGCWHYTKSSACLSLARARAMSGSWFTVEVRPQAVWPYSTQNCKCILYHSTCYRGKIANIASSRSGCKVVTTCSPRNFDVMILVQCGDFPT